MNRREMSFTDHYDSVIQVMRSRGLLLGAYDASDRANAMTIGWGAIGSIWAMPVWMVLVRPSRYTFKCIEQSGCFSVNVPGKDLFAACQLCGSNSGRDMDKLAAAGLTVAKGDAAAVPMIQQCPIIYQCQVVHRHDVAPGAMVRELLEGPYANGDYHRVYYGRILAAQAAIGVKTML
jgi:flavin reductase (DIM6/NTAB) family NADH-FMN oxidoreductase RutF